VVNPEAPLATYEFRRGEFAGSHLSLFDASVVHRGEGGCESIYLDRVAALGVAYERDTGRITWGCVLLFVATTVFAAFWPLRMLVASIAGEVSAQAQGGFLPAALRALDLGVSLLPAASLGIAIWAIALLILGWIGETVLRIVVAPAERIFATRGRDPLLYEFGESVSAQIAKRSR
jgi:hypothetical protein